MDKKQAQTGRDPEFYRALFLFQLLMLSFLVLLSFLAGPYMGFLSWWFVIINLLILIFILGATSTQAKEREIKMIAPDEQPSLVRDLMKVCIATSENGIDSFRGKLKTPAIEAYKKLKSAFKKEGKVPVLRADDELEAELVILPAGERELVKETSKRTPWLLFGLTLITTTFAGAAYSGADFSHGLAGIFSGLPYSLGLLSILGVHELGHYFAARYHKLNVTPPYFIPVPVALGTFGAFIQMKTPPEDRRALFDMAVAGPLAGVIVAIPVLWFGLQSSTLVPLPEGSTAPALAGGIIQNSFLFTVIARAVLEIPEGAKTLVALSPLAFAGWLGLVVTALNLVPVGQLDGGHIIYALCGRKLGDVISGIASWSLFLLAIFVWPGLLLWAIIVFFLAGRRSPVLNELTPLTTGRKILAILSIILFFLIIVPYPLLIGPDSIWRSPYL